MRYNKPHSSSSKYIKVFLDYYNLLEHEIFCAICGKVCNNIHHIDGRQGDKYDDINNLLPCCQIPCHQHCHGIGGNITKQQQYLFLKKWQSAKDATFT